MKRIVFITTGLSTGGAEMMLLRLVERLRGEFAQEVISLSDNGPIGERIMDLGVPVTTLDLGRTLPNPLAVVQLVRHIRRLRAAVVQTWMYHADFLGGLAARLSGVRSVAWNIRNNDLSPEKTSLRTRRVVTLCAWLSKRIPARIVCCSEAAMRTHVELGYDPTRFVIIPNGFDLERFRPDPEARVSVRTELSIPRDAPLIGLIARFDPQKNHAMFFAAASLLHRRRPEVHFLLVGRGVDSTNAQVERWMRDAGTGDVAHLLGERSDVQRLTAALDLASSSSSWGEAFPNVLGEAMACGVPCVSTDAGDAALIVGDTGRIVPRDDPRELARAWQEMLSLPDERRRSLGEAARERITERFEIGAIAKRYAALYRELAAEAR
jgi:glycosyltransferase involved in cell wall biosynthesis